MSRKGKFIGKIVHFNDIHDECIPAIVISGTNRSEADVMPIRSGMGGLVGLVRGVPFDGSFAPVLGSWHHRARCPF